MPTPHHQLGGLVHLPLCYIPIGRDLDYYHFHRVLVTHKGVSAALAEQLCRQDRSHGLRGWD